MLAASCQDEGRPTPPGEGGPLSASVVPGMKAVYAPRRTPYYFTHGSFILCSQEEDRDAPRPVLKGIDFNIRTAPLTIDPVLREVPVKSERRGPPFDWSPIGGVIGRPGNFPGFKVRGEFSTHFAGTKVEESCSDRTDPDAGFLELEIVMKVGKAGADVNGFTIRYEFGSQQHELLVPWRMVGCGSEVARRLCS